jgi:hypothetical protein
LVHPLKQAVEGLRQIILGAHDGIGEGIKWNAPSFHYEEHFATFNLHGRDFVRIIFHRGAKVKDPSTEGVQNLDGVLEWLAKDRCSARFYSMNDVDANRGALAEIVKQWARSM